jgi:hypothetical protein
MSAKQATAVAEDTDVQHLRNQVTQAKGIFARQSQRIEDLQWECDEIGIARDKALYWLLRLCDAAQREKWPLSKDATHVMESALDLLCENNIFVGLDEPDAAILRLMEIVARDQEGQSDGR